MNESVLYAREWDMAVNTQKNTVSYGFISTVPPLCMNDRNIKRMIGLFFII